MSVVLPCPGSEVDILNIEERGLIHSEAAPPKSSHIWPKTPYNENSHLELLDLAEKVSETFPCQCAAPLGT